MKSINLFNIKKYAFYLMFLFIIIVGMWSIGHIPKAQADESVYLYTVSDGKATITGYSGTHKDIIIPSTLGGYDVVSIGNSVFIGKGLTNVTFPNTLTYIENDAFKDNALTNVMLPDSLTSIGNYAFHSNELTSVTFGNSLTSIGDNAFNSNKLTSVTFPDSLTSIGNYAFHSNELTSVTFGNSLTHLGNNAFYNNKLTSVSLPDSLTIINNYAFHSNELTSVTFGNSLTHIGNNAFYNNKLTSVTFPDSLATINDHAFHSNILTSVTFLGEPTSIHNGAFIENYNDYANKIIITSFDAVYLNNYASVNNLPLNKVTFTPNGDGARKAQISTDVTIELSTVISSSDLVYQWSKAKVEPATTTTWTPFNNGETITTPNESGDWYLHIQMRDGTTKVGYIRSNLFKVEIVKPTVTYSYPEHIHSTTGHIYIPNGSSGDVSLSDIVSLDMPKNTTNQAWNISISPINYPNIPEYAALLSDTYSITQNLSTDLTSPFTLTVLIDPIHLNSNQRVGLFYYDAQAKTWVELEHSQLTGDAISVKGITLTPFTTAFAVMAVTKPLDEIVVTFSDLHQHWAIEAVYRATQLGFIEGYADGTFQPQKAVTRAEFAVMLMKALDEEVDVPSLAFKEREQIGDWAGQWIAQAMAAGYIQGYPNGEFQPNSEIRRAEMALIIFRVLALQEKDSNTINFVDLSDIPNWANKAITLLHNYGILQGRGNNTFGPHQSTTRAEAVTVILNMLDNIK